MAMKRNHTLGASLLLLFIFLYLPSHATAANSSFTRGGGLTDSQTLVSPNSIFTLGFLTLGEFNNRYLGIWFDMGIDLPYTYVWIANRDTPIGDSTGFLTIDDADGKLKITHSGVNGPGPFPLSSERAANGSVVTASLLNSGNFVLNETYSNGTGYRILWQSFDYPTDILLPGMKLGVNSKTGKNWSLISWISNQVPYAGAFTLEVDRNGTNQLVISRREEVYWRSGVWNGTNFENLPELIPIEEYSNITNQYNYSFVSNKDERYFTYSAKPGSYYSSAILVWRMRLMGQLEKIEVVAPPVGILGWGRLIDCRNKTKGCEGNKPSACRSGEEVFKQRNGGMSGRPYTDGPSMPNMSLSDCEIKCRSYCSCIAYASLDKDETRCNIWVKGSKFSGSGDTQIYLLTSKQGKKWWIWLSIAMAIALIMSLLASLSYLKWKKIKEAETSDEKVLLELGSLPSNKFGDANMLERHGKKGHEFILFKFDSIAAATDNFSSTNKLGEGGFGPVYKGTLLEGQEIAVKRLSRSSGQGLKEFKNEIVLIAKLQHRNLVRLLGCCIKGEEKMLIYEYMPNKSLDFFLFDPMGRELLDWKKRINVIEGIAQGLLYLHTYSRLRVIHRDLKASNILLDDEMNPKISDFGLARIFGLRESEANTNRIVGTYGYMSPEYAMEGIFSEKSDVFSFGVLLLEIVSGKKKSFNDFDRHLNLIGYAWELWGKGAGVELIDQMLDTSCCKDKMLRCIHVGLLCVQESATDRPTMVDVVSMFANEAMLLPAPKQPGFSTRRSVAEKDLLIGKPESCSLNALTMSVMEAR